MNSIAPHQKNRSRLAKLIRSWTQPDGFDETWQALLAKRCPVFTGAWGSGVSCILAAIDQYAISDGLESPLVIICDTTRQMDVVAEEMRTFSTVTQPVVKFPVIESTNPEVILRDWGFGQRLRVIQQLVQWADKDTDPTSPLRIVTCVGALMQGIPSAQQRNNARRVLAIDQEIDLDEFCGWLSKNGMHPVSAVQMPGEFARRGGIIDLFPSFFEKPIRIELFDTVVESIRHFDVSTQRSCQRCDSVEILVASPEIDGKTNFFDLLPDSAVVLVCEPEEVDAEATRREKVSTDELGMASWNDVRSRMAKCNLGSVQQLSLDAGSREFRFPLQPLDAFDGDLEELKSHVDQIASDYDVYLITPVEGELERLTEILSKTVAATKNRVHLVVGDCNAGFRDDQNSVAVISCDEVFKRGELRRRKTRGIQSKALDSFLDLRDNDLVVHLAHGIGRFRGLLLLEKDDVEQEHLCIEFYGGTKIYVPATKMDLIQRYVGGTKRSPTLAKVGGKSWLKIKEAAEDAIRDMASDMLEVQAQRSSKPGIRFNPDTQWQMEFEQAFPYTETDDQVRSIHEIKESMLSAQPMDRLLCGDVGFGKTEVAMRAAFKAVESGYQVGILVPTTVLAEQHYQTLRRRMASFPLDIGKLSRFSTRKEEKVTLEGVASGRVDIVVGTHRLAGKEVQFYNLGLLIIDEEQKFGVDVKERLKAMRSNVDVLTLSATPIPRTLHMSLVGVRNISNLETAPVDRIAVQTQLTRFDPQMIRQAILRELARGGQVFFVHNRISDIFLLRDRLKQIVPEASFRVGHGQMEAGELEEVMTQFVAGEFDVLIATTIVESGLDIPNANTIFIDDAQRYGLSDLHQLRGRVGRYKHRAYCYLLIDANTRLKSTASKRLQAIQHFSDLGAGFNIAMRDLEIRGAGNLLGTEQSGHIAAIGYELYCQLLEKAVRQLKKEPLKISIDVDIQLPGRGFLPDEYIDDRRQKIDFYRRLTRIENYTEIEGMKEELVDRFGPIPEPTQDLFKRMELKLDAAVWEITAVKYNKPFLVFEYSNPSRIKQLRSMKRSRLRITDGNQAFWQLDKDFVWTDEKILMLAKKILRPEVRLEYSRQGK